MQQIVSRRALFWFLLIAGGLLFLMEISSILLPFVVGMLAAYFLDPAADRLQRAGLTRSNASALIILGFFSVLLLLTLLLMPLVFQQLVGLVTALPDYIAHLNERYRPQVNDWLSRLAPDQSEALRGALDNVASTGFGVLGGFITGMFNSGKAVINLFSLILITPLVAFYLLKDWDGIINHIDTLLPRAQANIIREQINRIDETLAGFLRGQITVCMLMAAFYGIGLALTGLKFGLIIGLITGLLVILPYVGFLMGFVLALIIGFIQFESWTPFILMLGVFGAGQILESYFLTPRMVGSSVGLHPVWIIFGMLAGAALFGFVGILIAVPATAVIGVLIRFATERYLQSSYYRGNLPTLKQ